MGFKGWVRLGKITFNLKIFEEKNPGWKGFVAGHWRGTQKKFIGETFFLVNLPCVLIDFGHNL